MNLYFFYINTNSSKSKFMKYSDLIKENSEENKNDRLVQKHIDFFGMPVCVEIIKGGVKYSTTFDGKPWERTLKCDYGYFDGVTGDDGEYLDCYIGPEFKNPESKVFVIDQMRPDGSEFDEKKVILGCMNEEEAKNLYMTHCHSENCYGGMAEYTIDQFRKFLNNEKNGD